MRESDWRTLSKLDNGHMSVAAMDGVEKKVMLKSQVFTGDPISAGMEVNLKTRH